MMLLFIGLLFKI